MRPTLKQTTMSLALALAAVSGCSGGAETATQADKTTSSFRDGLPPTVRDGDKLSLADSSADFPLALRSAALKLTGNYPTLAEIKRVRDATDQASEYAKVIDEYMMRPEFSRQMLKFWQDTFRMGGTLNVTVGATNTAVNLDFAPMYAAMLVVNGMPFNNVLTATTGTCPTYNANTGVFTAGNCTVNPMASGVLTDAGVQAQFMSSMAFRRVRWIHETFLCSRYPAEMDGTKQSFQGGSYNSPWGLTTISGQSNRGSENPATWVNFQDTSALICANCHSTMNHIAPLFGKYDITGKLTGAIAVLTPVQGNPLTKDIDWLPTGEGTAYRFGKPVANVAAFGAAMAADPEFSKCMATRVWNWAMSRGDVINDQTTLTPAFVGQLSSTLVNNNWNMKTLVREVYTNASFVRF